VAGSVAMRAGHARHHQAESDRFMRRCGILGGLFLGVFSQDQFLGKLLQLRYASKTLN
jgi:hypothetical protein